MATESQVKSTPPVPPVSQRVFGREVRVLSKDPKFVDEVVRRRSNGEPIEKIAIAMKCHRNTVMNILHRNGGDPLEKVGKILRDGMPKIADMVIVETLRKKDVRAGVALLQGAGQLDSLKPKPAADEGGRIVIEWSGAPPPWAPASVLQAYAQRQVPAAVPSQVVDAKRDENVQDAEIVPSDTSVENCKTGQ